MEPAQVNVVVLPEEPRRILVGCCWRQRRGNGSSPRRPRKDGCGSTGARRAGKTRALRTSPASTTEWAWFLIAKGWCPKARRLATAYRASPP